MRFCVSENSVAWHKTPPTTAQHKAPDPTTVRGLTHNQGIGMRPPCRRKFALHLPNGTIQLLEADLTVRDGLEIVFHLERIEDVTNRPPEASFFYPSKKTPH
ncbi:hypothetical protein CHUV2995_00968 [Corynebacterium diphtheriae subsp. lausannense]|nr:hypothetical protein CHUV2995_00968 [Corynebacterium diphtheriae subsp. lausannense]